MAGRGDTPIKGNTFVNMNWADPFVENNDNGLTIREYYAGLAMQGLISNLSAIRKEGFKDSEISEFAVMQADALISLLSKEV